jgi:lipopolysaccharide transport system permease protein
MRARRPSPRPRARSVRTFENEVDGLSPPPTFAAVSMSRADVAAAAGALSAPSREAAGWVENRPSDRWFPRPHLGELWSYRELVLAFALKALRVRYKQTVFGVSWAVLQPLLAVILFSIIFGRLAGLPSDGIPYPVFNYSAMIVWLYVSLSVTGAAQSLVENRDLVTKIYFPRPIAPLAAALPGLVDLAIAFVLLVGILVFYGVTPDLAVLLTPAWVLAAVTVVLSIGIPLAALNVKYRDVRHGLPLLLQLWLFASPVVYSSSLVEGSWKYVYALNPMATVLNGFRWSIADGPLPGPEAFVSLGVVVVLLSAGLVYFARAERSFADVV